MYWEVVRGPDQSSWYKLKEPAALCFKMSLQTCPFPLWQRVSRRSKLLIQFHSPTFMCMQIFSPLPFSGKNSSNSNSSGYRSWLLQWISTFDCLCECAKLLLCKTKRNETASNAQEQQQQQSCWIIKIFWLFFKILYDRLFQPIWMISSFFGAKKQEFMRTQIIFHGAN